MKWLSTITSIIAAPFTGGASLVGGIVKGFADDYQAGRKNKREIAAAVAQNKIKLAQSAESHNNAWEMAQLEGKDNLLRRASFFMFASPFVIGIIAPDSVNNYFNVALSAVPDWYKAIFITIVGGIWGVSEFKRWKS